MTVSRVINGEGNVRENTREQVLAAIAKLNFAPNRAARSLAGGEQLRIALMFDNPSASYLSEFLMGALEEASRADIHLVVQNCENVAEAKSLVHHLIDGGIKGFILPPPLCDDQSVLDLITDAQRHPSGRLSGVVFPLHPQIHVLGTDRRTPDIQNGLKGKQFVNPGSVDRPGIEPATF